MLLILLPYLLPNSVTRLCVAVKESKMYPLWQNWGGIGACILGYCAGAYVMELMEKLYDYLRK